MCILIFTLRALLPSQCSQAQTQSTVLLWCTPGLAVSAELSGMSLPARSCWASVLLIAGVYTYALLEKVKPMQYWLKWKLVYYACGSSCRQLIKQPAVARCLLESLWDAHSFKRWFGWLVVEAVCWLSRLVVLFIAARHSASRQCVQGCLSFTPLVCGASEWEEPPLLDLARMDCAGHWGGLSFQTLLSIGIYQEQKLWEVPWFSSLSPLL